MQHYRVWAKRVVLFAAVFGASVSGMCEVLSHVSIEFLSGNTRDLRGHLLAAAERRGPEIQSGVLWEIEVVQPKLKPALVFRHSRILDGQGIRVIFDGVDSHATMRQFLQYALDGLSLGVLVPPEALNGRDVDFRNLWFELAGRNSGDPVLVRAEDWLAQLERTYAMAGSVGESADRFFATAAFDLYQRVLTDGPERALPANTFFNRIFGSRNGSGCASVLRRFF